MFKKKIFVFFLFLVVLLPIVDASFGYDNPTLPNIEEEQIITYRNITDTNSSDFWDNLNTPADITTFLLNTGDTATGNYTFDTDTLFVDSTNNRVGIGTDTPAYDLDIYNAGIAQMRFTGDFPLIGLVDSGAGGVSWNIENGREAAGILGFYSGGTKIVFDKDGNIGIGTTSPKHLLDVGGMEGIGAPGNLGIKSNSSAWAIRIEENSGVEGWHIGVDVDGDLNFDDSNTGIRLTFQDETGNVGIGTTSPGQDLEIYDSSPALRIRDSGATAGATTAFIEFGGTDGGNWNRTGHIGDGSSGNTGIYLRAEVGDLYLGDSSGATVLNLQGGNVGIGTASPDSKLQIDGNFTSETNATDSIGTLAIQWLKGFFVNLFVSGDLEVGGIIINDAIYCESSELVDQTFATAGVRYRLNISNIDEGNGITMTTGNNGTNITIDTSGVYHLVAQPQVKAGAGAAGDFHMWIEKHNTTQWADIPDSNIELKLSSLEEDVIVLATTLKLNQGEKLRLVVSVSDDGILLHAQSPAGEPVIPSIIFTMYRIGS